MRNPNRIPEFCNKLSDIWSKIPDWRFGQLMINLFNTIGDPFYLEDDKLIQKIEEIVNYWTEE